jgi:hypothetical protein
MIVNNITTSIETVIKKTLIALPCLVLVFLVYGINYEHGDSNAGSMYPLAFAVHFSIASVISYILYVITDRITYNSRINILKNFIHLILWFGLAWLHSKAVVLVVSLTLPTLLAVNLVGMLNNYLTKTS